MQNLPYILSEPEKLETCVVFSSPHSGRMYGDAFLQRSRLKLNELRIPEDAFVGELHDFAPDCGAPLLAAQIPRSFIDLNRGKNELDPALIEGVRKQSFSPRVANGFGVIPRLVRANMPIYTGKLTQEDAHERIRLYWQPYHNALARLLKRSHQCFKRVVLLDCHSMPSCALESFQAWGTDVPDIILGDLYGASCGQDVICRLEKVLGNVGLKVGRNIPFSGAYILRHYGRPSHNVHAIQIEINRSLYMDEAHFELHDGAKELKHRLKTALSQFCVELNGRLEDDRVR